MKRTIAVLLVLIFILSSVTPGYCSSVRKFGRGVWNLITWPAEIPNRIIKVGETNGAVEAATSGLIQGIVMSVYRLAMGVYEAGTFFIPLPDGYEPMLKDPEFFFLKIKGDPKN